MSDKHANFTPEEQDINNKMTPFRLQLLSNFPFIEADFDALTIQQLLSKVVEYLNNVIENENNVSTEVIGLYNAYQSLQNYVNTYFDDMEVINFELVKTEGLKKTYRVTFYNLNTYEFSVFDGRGITSITKIAHDDTTLIDTYQILYNDNTTQDFSIQNANSIEEANYIVVGGEKNLVNILHLEFTDGQVIDIPIKNAISIKSITKDSTNGLVDTYQILMNDGSKTYFDVTNGAQGPQGEVGPQGPKGDTGATGPANSLSIGTVTKGSTAGATITGNAPHQVLNLTLPKGDTGATGPQGPQGPQGPAGDVGQFSDLSIGTVVSGTTANATITGEAPHQVLNLTLPKGDTGDQGPQGPKGDTGATGPQGPQGPAGSVDETVLYEGNSYVTHFDLNDSYKNYSMFKIYYKNDIGDYCETVGYIGETKPIYGFTISNSNIFKKAGTGSLIIQTDIIRFNFTNSNSNKTVNIEKYTMTSNDNIWNLISNGSVSVQRVVGIK